MNMSRPSALCLRSAVSLPAVLHSALLVCKQHTHAHTHEHTRTHTNTHTLAHAVSRPKCPPPVFHSPLCQPRTFGRTGPSRWGRHVLVCSAGVPWQPNVDPRCRGSSCLGSGREYRRKAGPKVPVHQTCVPFHPPSSDLRLPCPSVWSLPERLVFATAACCGRVMISY